jgi:GAF domain-containing protein
MSAPVHPYETTRLESLRRHALLDTAPDRRFDRLICMTAQILRVNIALITVMDEKRLWLKAAVGTRVKENPRETALCAYALLEESMLVVEDTFHDMRFAYHPAVTGPPLIRFYAGVPLRGRDGLPLGTLCVIDTQPRALTMEQKHSLLLLSREAEDLMQSTEFDQ